MEKIVIAPYLMQKSLLAKFRKDNIFANPKLITRDELFGKYFGVVNEFGAYYLFANKNYIYDNLISLLPFIPRATENCIREKNVSLFALKQELEKNGFIERDEFFDQFKKDKEVEIYGYSKDDNELISLLNNINVSYRFVPYTKGEDVLCVKNFALIEDEIFYMLNEISKLLDSGVSADDIFIYTENENAIFYIKKYYESFGFKVNFPNDVNLYSQESVSAFLDLAKLTNSFDVGFEYLKSPDTFAGEDVIQSLQEICNVNLPFEKKYDYVVSSLKEKMIANPHYENAINIIAGPMFVENKYIFIPCFAQNIFPKSYKDIDYISDEDKKELSISTSLEECRIEDSMSKAFILSKNHFYLSRSSASFSEKYFPSPFVKSLGIKEIEIKDIPDVIYSKKYAEFRLGLDKDNELYFLQHSKCMDSLSNLVDINYRGYDNSYVDAQAISQDDFLKFSYTSIKTFFECPFAYYLNSILKISNFEDNFNTKFGKVAHYVFEHQYDDGFDFETAFEEQRNEQQWEPSEELFVDKLKEDIKHASDAAILHCKSYARNPVIKTELNLHTYIDSHTLLEGKIDKAILLDGKDAILIDYKTGKEGFKKKQLEYGLSMQLPTYAYLFSNCKEFKDYRITGLYINNVVNRSYTLEKGEDEIIDSYLKLNGITIADLDVASRIDSSIINGKSLFIAGLSQNGGKFKGTNSIAGNEEINEMEKFVLDKYLEANERIRNNKFEIAPLFMDGNDPCKNCEHRDICFVREYQKRVKKEDKDETNGN